MNYPQTASLFVAELNSLESSLSAGDLDRSRRHLVRASRFCITDEEERLHAYWTLRAGLVSGRYTSWNDPAGPWQISRKRWPDDGVLHTIGKALFAAAGWEQNSPAASDRSTLPDLLEHAVLPGQVPLEEVWAQLSIQASLIQGQPSLLTQEALPSHFIDRLGQRILPPILESLVAELWAVSKTPRGMAYPRLAMLQDLARSEPSFVPTVGYLQCLEALRRGDFSLAAAQSDHLFRTQDKWLWLRVLPLTIYFGSQAQYESLPRRLQQVGRDHFAPSAKRPLPAEYRDLAASVIAQLLSLPLLDDDTRAALLRLQDLHFPDPHVTLWSVPPGACLPISALLGRLTKRSLPKSAAAQLTPPGLAATHAFLRGLWLWEKEEIGRTTDALRSLLKSWKSLPEAYTQALPWRQPLLKLLSTLRQLPDVAEAASALRERGVASDAIALAIAPELTPDLVSSNMSEWLVAERLASLSVDTLRSHWENLVYLCLGLDDRHPPPAWAAAVLSRLTSKDMLPTELVRAHLSKIASKLSDPAADNAVRTIQAHLARLCGLSGLPDAAERLLQVLAHDVASAVTAELWLCTGNAAYFAEDSWRAAKTPWSEAAYTAHQLLTLSWAPTPPADRVHLPADVPAELTAGLAAIQRWLVECIENRRLMPLSGPDAPTLPGPRWAAFSSRPPVLGATVWTEFPLMTLVALAHKPQEPDDAANLVPLVQSLLRCYSADTRIRLDLVALALARLARADGLAYEATLKQCDGIMTGNFRWALRRALLAVGEGAQAQALASQPVSEGATKMLRLPLRQTSEKALRLMMMKISPADMESVAVWDFLAGFMNSGHWRSHSFAQWDLVHDWRLKVAGLDPEVRSRIQEELTETLLPARSDVLSRLIFRGRVRPALIDVNNLILDEMVHGHFDDAVDFIKALWETLEGDFYPILSFLDKGGRGNHDPAVLGHLQRLVKAELIDAATGRTGDAATADYRILEYAWQLQQERPVLITNDYYAKDYRATAGRSEPNGWKGHPDFPWLTTNTFDAMAARISKGFAPMTWDLHVPTGSVLTIHAGRHQ